MGVGGAGGGREGGRGGEEGGTPKPYAPKSLNFI